IFGGVTPATLPGVTRSPYWTCCLAGAAGTGTGAAAGGGAAAGFSTGAGTGSGLTGGATGSGGLAATRVSAGASWTGDGTLTGGAGLLDADAADAGPFASSRFLASWSCCWSCLTRSSYCAFILASISWLLADTICWIWALISSCVGPAGVGAGWTPGVGWLAAAGGPDGDWERFQKNQPPPAARSTTAARPMKSGAFDELGAAAGGRMPGRVPSRTPVAS